MQKISMMPFHGKNYPTEISRLVYTLLTCHTMSHLNRYSIKKQLRVQHPFILSTAQYQCSPSDSQTESAHWSPMKIALHLPQYSYSIKMEVSSTNGLGARSFIHKNVFHTRKHKKCSIKKKDPASKHFSLLMRSRSRYAMRVCVMVRSLLKPKK